MKLNSTELNLARRCLLEKAVKYFLKREGIKALYVQGSVAADSTDEFSDIDLRVVIESKFTKNISLSDFLLPNNGENGFITNGQLVDLGFAYHISNHLIK